MQVIQSCGEVFLHCNLGLAWWSNWAKQLVCCRYEGNADMTWLYDVVDVTDPCRSLILVVFFRQGLWCTQCIVFWFDYRSFSAFCQDTSEARRWYLLEISSFTFIYDVPFPLADAMCCDVMLQWWRWQWQSSQCLRIFCHFHPCNARSVTFLHEGFTISARVILVQDLFNN